MFLSYLIFKWKNEANLNKQVIWIHEMSTKFTINRCLRVKRVIEFQFEYLKKKNKKKGKFASLSSSIWISFLFFNSLIPFYPSSFLCPLYPDFVFSFQTKNDPFSVSQHLIIWEWLFYLLSILCLVSYVIPCTVALFLA